MVQHEDAVVEELDLLVSDVDLCLQIGCRVVRGRLTFKRALRCGLRFGDFPVKACKGLLLFLYFLVQLSQQAFLVF